MSIKKIRNIVFEFTYTNFLRPILFLIDPEKIHNIFISIGELIQKISIMRAVTRMCFDYSHPKLTQKIKGLTFKNPIGLAAGFDKDARIVKSIADVGFGFIEVGTVTGRECKGNSGTRLWRHKNKKSLRVYYGLKNDGCEVVSNRLKNINHDIVLGVSIGKTNDKCTVDTDKAILDYKKSYQAFDGIADYITVNISCPNTFGGEPFATRERLEKLLKAITENKYDVPIFIKMSPDLNDDELDDIIDIAREFEVTGFISTNLTKKHDFENGGLSGGAVAELADKQIEYIYKRTRGEFLIIGCGGVFTADDAYRKIRLGASLIQLITGMIYLGPQMISSINMGLVELLNRDGFENIKDAIGVDVK